MRRWADEMLALSPTALRFLKQSFNADTEQLAGVGQLAFTGLELFVESDEAREGVRAFTEKRAPDFAPLPGAGLGLVSKGGQTLFRNRWPTPGRDPDFRRECRAPVSWLSQSALACLLVAAAPARAQDPVIAAAGDIACDPRGASFNNGDGEADRCRQRYTSDLLVGAGLAPCSPLGDVQYEDGTLEQFQGSYDPSWGRVKSITRPVIGNHEYRFDSGGSGYWDYFNGVGIADGPAGERGKGWYSFDVGDWHLIALNSMCAAGRRLRRRVRAGAVAARRPRGELGRRVHARLLAPPAVQLGAGGQLRGHAVEHDRSVGGALRGGRRRRAERARPPLRALRAPGPLRERGRPVGLREFVVGTGGSSLQPVGRDPAEQRVRPTARISG